MIYLDIDPQRQHSIEHLVLDFNGTLACDGILLEGVRERLETLAGELQVHILTADTFGKCRSEMGDMNVDIHIIPAGNEAETKRKFVADLGAGVTLCIGNGSNDEAMLQAAALGIAVMEDEGTSKKALLAADILCKGITQALDLLLHPQRIKATLRS